MTKEQIEFRNKLFPNGQPTPEEFIQKIAELCIERMEEERKNKQ